MVGVRRKKVILLNIDYMKSQLQTKQLITTLQQDLPTLFEQDISYQIYTHDIYFRDPVNKFKGKFNYRLIFWTLRFHGRLFCIGSINRGNRGK